MTEDRFLKYCTVVDGKFFYVDWYEWLKHKHNVLKARVKRWENGKLTIKKVILENQFGRLIPIGKWK